MPNTVVQVGGRPSQIDRDDIARAGRELGMHQLSVKAVAARLGVTPTALYRHVDGRWGLERLVGDSLLADLQLCDDPDHDTPRQLLAYAEQLRRFVVARPGLAAHLQTLFPRGDQGVRLLAEEVQALTRRGYHRDAAVVLAGAVGSLAIGFAAMQEQRSEAGRADGPGYARAIDDVLSRIHQDEELGAAHDALPTITDDDYGRMLLAASIRGIVAVAPPGRPVGEFLAELSAAGADTTAGEGER